jgi:HEAT repeat protein
MKKLSDEARLFIASLWRPSTAVGRALGRHGSWNLELVQQLGVSREPAAIPHLAPALFSDDAKARTAAAHAISSLLQLLSIDDLPHLDESMRSGWYTETWRKLEPRELASLVGPGQAGATVLEVSSMHPNGFVREEAVRRLALRSDGSELPYLLLRINDWVRQVRQAAVETVERKIAVGYARHFTKALFLVVRLERTRRGDHLPILSRIYDLLASPAARDPMLAELRSGAGYARRASFRILTRPPSDDIAGVLLAAAKANDSVIRLWAVRSLATALEPNQLRAVLSEMFRDPSAPVRREALRAWVTIFVKEAEDVLEHALLDRSASVRAFARFHLANRGQDWQRRFYRDAVGRGRLSELPPAIAGLAETGGLEDAAVVESFLGHRTTTIRCTAVRYLIRLGGEEFIDRVFQCMTDHSRGVSNQSRQAVQPYVARIGGLRLWQCFSEDRSLHVRRNALRLLSALPKWEALSYLIKATLDRVPSLSELARDYVVRWDAKYNRTQAAPTDEQLLEARSALAVASEKLPSNTLESISFSIRTFEGA